MNIPDRLTGNLNRDAFAFTMKYLEKFFREQDEERIDKYGQVSRKTNSGFYIPSSLRQLDQAFDILLQRHMIKTGSLFLDAGSGDGRIVALAERKGLTAFGIESDRRLFEISTKNLLSLGCSGRIVHGDFLKDSAYEKIGISFSAFPLIYNFVNSCNELAEKISKEGNDDVRFLLYDTSSISTHWEGLTLLDTMLLRDPEKIRQSQECQMQEYSHNGRRTIERKTAPQKISLDLPLIIDYLHIYRKGTATFIS